MGRPSTRRRHRVPELNQPQGQYVTEAEDEFDGQEVTWPQVHARAWELQEQDEGK